MVLHLSLRSWADILSAADIPCFPCLPNKRPLTPRGFHDATTDIATLDLWFDPDLTSRKTLIGVPTGPISGIDVLDLDLEKHPEAAAWHAEHAAGLPPTQTHQTRSGGLHLLFAHHEGVCNSAGRIAPGVDVRGTGGYVVWWPASGYAEANDRILFWPDWLLPLVLQPEAVRLPVQPRPQLPADAGHRLRYAEAALRNATIRVASAPEGMRNSTLNAETFSLMRLVREGAIEAADVAGSMAAAAIGSGLSERETRATLASAMAAGAEV